jgi:hypothetical protein
MPCRLRHKCLQFKWSHSYKSMSNRKPKILQCWKRRKPVSLNSDIFNPIGFWQRFIKVGI